MSASFWILVSEWAPWVTLLFAIPFLRREREYHRALLYFVLLFVTLLLVSAIKLTTNIPRPEDALVMVPGPSFPSHHAAVGFFPLGMYWLISKTPARLALFVYGALVTYSRLALRVHYPADVLVGALVGFALPYAFMRYERHVLRAYTNFKTRMAKLRV